MVASFDPPGWRRLTSAHRLSYRLVRDGFHGLCVLSGTRMVGIVPGAIVTLEPGTGRFRVTHQLDRGTRPLNITATPEGKIYFGEYFDNGARDAVNIYGSDDGGASWHVVHTFPKGAIRHVHNIVYDQWQDCLWVLTGDWGSECRIMRASKDFNQIEGVQSGSQNCRAVAIVCTAQSIYFATDNPREANYICRLDRAGVLSRLVPISGTSFHGCQVDGSIFFSTVVEHSKVNLDRCVRVYGSVDTESWTGLLDWRKDWWPMKLFQFGNAVLPTGRNDTDLLAVTGLGVSGADLTTGLWRVSQGPPLRTDAAARSEPMAGQLFSR